ncbi:MAG: CsbD family protein [Bdellovibrionaceae bacterium]|nr:CsbD family protein [Bdellovibrio sp.]
MNNDTLKGKWTEIKGEIQKQWGNLTGDDLDKTKGDMTAVGGLLQQKYGMAKADFHEKLSGIYSKFEAKKEEILRDSAGAAEKAKNDLRDSNKKH